MKNVIVGVGVVVGLIAVAGSASGQFGGGAGDPCDPYLIAEPNHLFALAADPNHYDKHCKLTADIDLDNNLTGLAPFATGLIAPGGGPLFTGTFDGNDHKITNLTIDTGGVSTDHLGLFGGIGAGGQWPILAL